MVALGMLALGYAVASGPVMASVPRRFSLAAAFLLAASFAGGCLWFNATVRTAPLQAALSGLGPHPKILMLSGEAAVGHPLVRDVHGIWVSRQENLWIREFVRLTLKNGPVDPPTRAKLDGYLALERNWLIEDFRKQPPDVVLVDRLRDDWGAWAHADPEITELLRPYTRVKTIDGIDILRRDH
jgi:hypothetical protein